MREVTGAEHDLATLFAPRSVAVIGASGRPGALSWWPLHLLDRYGFKGEVYPVNPTRDAIDGRRCYATLADVPGPVDVAVIALNAAQTPAALEACAQAGVRVAVLPTQGIGEAGPDGAARQQQLVAQARAHGLRIAGPNTDGVARFANGAVASIQPVLGQDIQPGPVAVVTQSGATAASLVRRLQLEGLGCGLYASTGNEADLGLEDYLSYALQDPEIRIVLSFVESIRRPADFRAVCDLAREVGKPIALIKVGRSEVGARRAAAHTGALAGADAVYDAVFRARGVIRVAELSELVAVAKLHLAIGAPASNGIGIISVSGGQAGALADVAATRGLELPALPPAQEARLNDLLTFGQGFNPCDVTGEIATNPALVGDLSDAFGTTPGIDTVVYARKELTGDVGARAAAALAAMRGRAPVAVYAIDGAVEGAEAEVYGDAGIPVFTSAHELFTAIGALAAWRQAGLVPAESGHPPRRVLDGAATLGEHAAKQALATYGFDVTREGVVHDRDAAAAMAERLGYPVVLKASSDRIPHKTEARCVVLDLRSAEAVRHAYDDVIAAVWAHLGDVDIDGVLVSQQVPAGVEAIVGVAVDPDFGPMVMVGLGGIFTEVLRDVALRPAPVSVDEALAMIGSLKGRSILEGARGRPPADVAALARTVSLLSEFAVDHSDLVREIDLNPVIVLDHGAVVVDALIIAMND